MRPLLPLAALAVLMILPHCSSAPSEEASPSSGEESGSEEGSSGDSGGADNSGSAGNTSGSAKSGSTSGAAKSGTTSGSTSGKTGTTSGSTSGKTGTTSGSTSGAAKSGATSGSTTGKSGATGGDAGVVSGPPGPPNGYPLPAATAKDLATWDYRDWKKYHYEDCSADEGRVKFDTPAQTVSEGIGYGMIGAVANDDQATFKKLRNYYFKRLDGKGLMNWKINGCTTSPTGDGMNAATDADLDVAMALVSASCKGWEGATADANKILDAIRVNEVDGTILKPGDAFGGADIFNPSYFAPGYYRVFAAFQPAQASFWTGLADATYPLLEKCANKTTGFVPDWCNSSGGIPGGKSGIYGYDAARTPWRIATDYLWFKTAAAKTFVDRTTKWINANGGPSAIKEKYSLDGSKFDIGTASPTEYTGNSTFIGALAVGAMASSEADSKAFGTAYRNVPAFADNGEIVTVDGVKYFKRAYFHASLRVVYTAVMTGLLQPTCK